MFTTLTTLKNRNHLTLEMYQSTVIENPESDNHPLIVSIITLSLNKECLQHYSPGSVVVRVFSLTFLLRP